MCFINETEKKEQENCELTFITFSVCSLEVVYKINILEQVTLGLKVIEHFFLVLG